MVQRYPDALLTIGEESIGVGIVQSSGGGQAGGGGVAVAQVLGALNLGQVGSLMDGSGGLVLSVACTADSGQSAEVQRAVDDVAARGEGVGEDVAGAGTVYIRAVGSRDTRGSAATLRDDLGEDGGDLRANRGRLEVLVDLGGID
jgi:hypothetical protein